MLLKKSLSLLLCTFLTLSLCLFALPKTVRAAADYTMNFSSSSPVNWHGGVQKNYSNDNDSDVGWEWIAAGKQLTLSGLSFETTEPIALKLPAGATLVLADGSVNSVKSIYNSTVELTYGLYCLGDLTVNGGGELTATGGTTEKYGSFGIFVDGSLNVSGGGRLCGVAGTARHESFGIFSHTLTLTDTSTASTVEGRGGATTGLSDGRPDPYSFGVDVRDSISMSGDNKLIGVSGTSNTSYGISTDSGFNISGGTIIADGSKISSARNKAFDFVPPTIDPSYSTYHWRTTKEGAYNTPPVTGSIVYVNYFELRPNLSDVVPKLADIAAPAPIDSNGTLALPAVTVTETFAGPVSETGYQLSGDNFATFDTINASTPIPITSNGFLLRAYADNVAGRGYSNAVAITVLAPVPTTPSGSVYSSAGDGDYTFSQYVGEWSGSTLTIQADCKKLTSVVVDGIQLKQGADHTVECGSTIITLTPSYLASLKDGTHSLRAQFTDGRYDGSFTTPLNTALTTAAAPSVPATGGMGVGYALLALAAVLALRKRQTSAK